jgi:hypothetical protein
VEVCPDIANAPTVTIDSLQAVQPATANAVDGTVPPVTPATSLNVSSAFALESNPPQDLVVILKNSGTVTVSAINVQPAASSGMIQWELDRDTSDTVDTAVPQLSTVTGAQTTFQPSAAGNFRLIAFVSPSGSGPFVEGEQLRVLRFAIVQATLQVGSGSTFNLNNTIVSSGLSRVITNTTSNALKSPMVITATYLLQGGGKTQTLGTAPTALAIGDIGNLTADTFSVDYPGTPDGTATEVVKDATGAVLPWPKTTPMVDTLLVRLNTPTSGGVTPYRGTNSSQTVTPAPAVGRLVQYTGADAPGFAWLPLHPTTAFIWGTTTGSNSFQESMVAFSASFPQTYLALHQASWVISVVGSNSNQQGWTNTGSGVTGSTALQPAGATAVQVRGLSFTRQAAKIYTTGNQ